MMVNFGGFQPLSLSDWPGKATSVAFLRGCPLRCPYCHNRWLQDGSDPVRTDYVANLVNGGLAQVPRVVFSGGEPLMQADALREIVKLLDPRIEVGIETSGVFSGSLHNLVEEHLIDRVFLDVKAHEGKMYRLMTGQTMDGDHLMTQVLATMYVCKEHNVPVTVRTTVYQGYPNEAAIEEIRSIVNGYSNVEELVIQHAIQMP